MPLMSSMGSHLPSEPEAGRRPPFKASLEVDNLPPLPEVAWRILELTSDLYLGVAQLSDLIARDQHLTARVLRIANSAFFQRSRQVKSVREAAVLLGNRKIRGIVVAASLGGVLEKSPHGKALWEHALAVALASREMAVLCSGFDPDEAFVSGLLHDIGKGLFDYQHPLAFMDAVALANATPELSTTEAERRFLGMDHLEAGELVADAWNLPLTVRDVIRHHHDPGAAEESVRLCCLVHVADQLCCGLGHGPIRRPLPGAETLECSSELGLTEGDLNAVAEDFSSRFKQDKQLFGF